MRDRVQRGTSASIASMGRQLGSRKEEVSSPSQEGQERLAPQFWARGSNGKVECLESLMETQTQHGVLCPFKGSVLLRHRVHGVCLALLSFGLIFLPS